MLFLLALCAVRDEVERTPAIYRCPRNEAESKFFPKLVNEDEYDSYCVDPKPGAQALATVKEAKLTFTPGSKIDTPANRKWRDLTIKFAMGKISPKAWLSATSNLGEMIHYLSSPSTPTLRNATPSYPLDGTYSARSVFAEMVLLSSPKRVCLNSTDIYQTRYFPEDKRFESWVLAMNDYLGPMLASRHDRPFWVTQKPTVVRADANPGMMILRQASGKRVDTFYYNNSLDPIPMPEFDLSRMTINRGVNLDGPKPVLQPTGFCIVSLGDD